MESKIKVLVLGDHPFAPSGVGTQIRYMVEHLLETGKFQFHCVAGAVKHRDYKPQKTDKWGDDLVIFPVDGYGNKDLVRIIMRKFKPDIVWFMTDPRFWGWLWEMEDEIRPLCPMVYYHVWDNYPYPTFNKKFYDSNDVVVTISKVTDDIVRTVAPDVECIYLPHSVDQEVFKPLEKEEIKNLRSQNFQADEKDKFLFFWNNRNARRKQSGSLIFWFKEFLDEVGHDKAMLLMHTDTKDPHGQNLKAIIAELGLTDRQIMFSESKLPPEHLAAMYNMADCTINISDAEGFGLATLESLSCGTPIIATMTGGLQQQVTDGKEFFGIGIQPTSKAIIGSQEVPWIYEDRIAKEDFLYALKQMLACEEGQMKEWKEKATKWTRKEYPFERYTNGWEKILTDIHEKYGSWETRKGYSRIKQKEF